MNRYSAFPGTLVQSEDGEFVEYAVAKRDIERLAQELFAVRAALHALEKQRAADIERKDQLISDLNECIRRAGVALGFDDPDEDRT
jgi:predicted alpha/beta hydrolase family esterase